MLTKEITLHSFTRPWWSNQYWVPILLLERTLGRPWARPRVQILSLEKSWTFYHAAQNYANCRLFCYMRTFETVPLLSNRDNPINWSATFNTIQWDNQQENPDMLCHIKYRILCGFSWNELDLLSRAADSGIPGVTIVEGRMGWGGGWFSSCIFKILWWIYPSFLVPAFVNSCCDIVIFIIFKANKVENMSWWNKSKYFVLTLWTQQILTGQRNAWRYVIKWKHFQRYWPFVSRIHRWPVDSPQKGQWRGALMSSLILAWANGWANNQDAGDLRRHPAHYDAIVMFFWVSINVFWIQHIHSILHTSLQNGVRVNGVA